MASVFSKLNLKDQKEVVVLNSPASFEEELGTLRDVSVVRAPEKIRTIHFALVFATTQAELDRWSKFLVAMGAGDVVLWIAYPKKSSTRYSCDFNRDSGWDVLRGAGFDTVRQVAIDDDWSALRFRKTEYIKRR